MQYHLNQISLDEFEELNVVQINHIQNKYFWCTMKIAYVFSITYLLHINVYERQLFVENLTYFGFVHSISSILLLLRAHVCVCVCIFVLIWVSAIYLFRVSIWFRLAVRPIYTLHITI